MFKQEIDVHVFLHVWLIYLSYNRVFPFTHEGETVIVVSVLLFL